jgi:uncharacterized membrane protein
MIPRFHLWWMIAAVIAITAVSAAFYPRLPDPCPMHWNIHGQVDDYGSPLTVALIGPAIAAGLTLLLLVLPVIGPFRRNMESFRVVYGRIGALILTFFIAFQVVTLLAATGRPLRMGALFTVLIGVMFACLGNWMGKVRRNFYVGIRTPWTLANEVVWEKTHRLGGKLFVVAGMISAVTGFFASEVTCFIVLMTALLGSVAWSVVYSLVIYRRLGQVDDLGSENRGESLKGVS